MARRVIQNPKPSGRKKPIEDKPEKMYDLGVDGISDQQRIFCEKLLEGYSKTQAYAIAYDSQNYTHCADRSRALLKRPNVIAYIRKRRLELTRMTGITKMRVIKEYARVAFGDMADLIVIHPTRGISINPKAKRTQLRALSELSFGRTGTKIKFHDKVKALERLEHLLGFDESDEKESLTEKIEHLASLQIAAMAAQTAGSLPSAAPDDTEDV